MPSSSSKHHSSRPSSHSNKGSSSKRKSRYPKFKSSKGDWEGMSSGSSNLEALKKRVRPSMIEGKTAEDFRKPYFDSLREADEMQEGLNDSKERLARLEEHRYAQEMERMLDSLIDSEMNSKARDNHRSRGGRKKKH